MTSQIVHGIDHAVLSGLSFVLHASLYEEYLLGVTRKRQGIGEGSARLACVLAIRCMRSIESSRHHQNPPANLQWKSAWIDEPEKVSRETLASGNDEVGHACLAHDKLDGKIERRAPFDLAAPLPGDRAKPTFLSIKRGSQLVEFFPGQERRDGNAPLHQR